VAFYVKAINYLKLSVVGKASCTGMSLSKTSTGGVSETQIEG